MIDPAGLRRRATPIDRSADRLVALGAIALAVAFLVAAPIASFLPEETRQGAWLPLHLALAGGATSAIAGVMPFFAAAFAAAPPADARLRATALGAVALGAVAISAGVVGNVAELAVGGGIAFLAGIGLTVVATVRPLGGALGPSRGLITQGYVVALVQVAVGAGLATLYLAGWPPVAEAWTRLKPAHAWLNIIGFVSLVVATTLLHFFPTVVGARIEVRTSARVTVIGLALGAPLVAFGVAASSDAVARLGAACVAVGAIGLAVYAWRTWQTRTRWTTDPGWHRFAIGGLVSALAWFEAGMLVAAGRVAAFGADPSSWSVDAVGGPIVAGWIGFAILAAATHLLPAVGPGDQAIHARQRRALGRLASLRLAVLNAGVAALTVGLAGDIEILVPVGAVLTSAGLGATALLIADAAMIGIGRHRG